MNLPEFIKNQERAKTAILSYAYSIGSIRLPDAEDVARRIGVPEDVVVSVLTILECNDMLRKECKDKRTDMPVKWDACISKLRDFNKEVISKEEWEEWANGVIIEWFPTKDYRGKKLRG